MVHYHSVAFETFQNLARKAIEELESRIEKIQNGELDELKIEQLQFIKQEIGCMLRIKSSVDYTPAYPRIIVDSWDYNSTLGNTLLELHKCYRKLV